MNLVKKSSMMFVIFFVTSICSIAQKSKKFPDDFLIVNTGTVNNKPINNNIYFSTGKSGEVQIKNEVSAKVGWPIVVTFGCAVAMSTSIKDWDELTKKAGNYKRHLVAKFETGEILEIHGEIDKKGKRFVQKFSGNSPIDIFDIDKSDSSYEMIFSNSKNGFSYTTEGSIRYKGKDYKVSLVSKYSNTTYVFPYSSMQANFIAKLSTFQRGKVTSR